MLRPLYLDAAVPWQITLDDGVALRIAAPGRARSLYPLRRLARVVCARSAQWQCAALLACMEAGVPVVFHDAAGEPVGWCFGPRRRETTLALLLREGIGRHDWQPWFDAWRRHAERGQMLAVLRPLGLPAARLEAGHVRALLCNRLRQRAGAPAGRWLRALNLACAGMVAEALQRELGDPALLAHARPGLHLPREIGALLQWRQHEVLLRARIADLGAQPPARFAAAAVEAPGALLQRACGALLGELELALREWLL